MDKNKLEQLYLFLFTSIDKEKTLITMIPTVNVIKRFLVNTDIDVK